MKVWKRRFIAVLAVLCFLSLADQALAEDLALVNVTSDSYAPGTVKPFILVLNGNDDVIEVRYDDLSWPIQQVNQGITLLEVQGHKIVTLRGQNIDGHHGGTIILSYTKNALTGASGKVVFEVRREPEWTAYKNNQQGRVPFKNMFLKKNEILGQAVGVEKVQLF